MFYLTFVTYATQFLKIDARSEDVREKILKVLDFNAVWSEFNVDGLKFCTIDQKELYDFHDHIFEILEEFDYIEVEESESISANEVLFDNDDEDDDDDYEVVIKKNIEELKKILAKRLVKLKISDNADSVIIHYTDNDDLGTFKKVVLKELAINDNINDDYEGLVKDVTFEAISQQDQLKELEICCNVSVYDLKLPRSLKVLKVPGIVKDAKELLNKVKYYFTVRSGKHIEITQENWNQFEDASKDISNESFTFDNLCKYVEEGNELVIGYLKLRFLSQPLARDPPCYYEINDYLEIALKHGQYNFVTRFFEELGSEPKIDSVIDHELLMTFSKDENVTELLKQRYNDECALRD